MSTYLMASIWELNLSPRPDGLLSWLEFTLCSVPFQLSQVSTYHGKKSEDILENEQSNIDKTSGICPNASVCSWC
jgi:hypothetical protein